MDTKQDEIIVPDAEVQSLVNYILDEYLPFITEMMKKVKGTAVEKKWIMMKDSIKNPKKK